MKKIYLALVPLLVMLTACAPQEEPITQRGLYLDTFVSVTIYDKKDEVFLKDALALCEKYDKLFSKTVESSDVYGINHANGEKISINSETALLLEGAKKYEALSNGAFNVAIEPVNMLWDFKSEHPSLPNPKDIAAALPYVDTKKIELTKTGDTYIYQAPATTKVDLGGIAKGYIGGKMLESLKSHGVENALIDLGGNIVTLGSKNLQGYKIGVKSPFDPAAVLASLTVADRNVVTSGIYERYIEVDGTTYHHILDTQTGYPVENNIASVTIVSSDGMMADALSTACFALGETEGLALIESLENAQCIFVLKDGSVITSQGMEQYAFTPLLP